MNKDQLSPKLMLVSKSNSNNTPITSKLSNGKIIPNSFTKKNTLACSTNMTKTKTFNCNRSLIF